MQELWTEHLMERHCEFVRDAKSEVVILSPFIKVAPLGEIVDRLRRVKATVVTRWRTADVLCGVCDLEIFELLSSKRIPLTVNQHLHMKGIVRDRCELLLGTANITAAGLGSGPRSNIECATAVGMQAKDRLWLAEIMRTSTRITRPLYDRFRAHVEKQSVAPAGVVQEFDFDDAPRGEVYSVFELPAVASPHQLVERLRLSGVNLDASDWDQTVREAQAFKLPLSVSSAAVALCILRENFFLKPTIRALLAFIATRRYFGEVKQWLRHHCWDAQTLTNADLVQRVRAVFNWIVTLGDGGFVVRRPHFSECIVRLGS